MLHIWSTAYNTYCIHQVCHHLKIDYLHCKPVYHLTSPIFHLLFLLSWRALWYSIHYSLTTISQPIHSVPAPFVSRFGHAASRSANSKYSSKVGWSWPPNSDHHGSQVYLQPSLIIVFKSISYLPLWSPLCASPNSLNYVLKLCNVTVSKCISQLAPSWPPCLHDHGLHVHLQICLIPAFQYILKFIQWGQQSLHDDGIKLHLEPRLIIAIKCICKLPGSLSSGASHMLINDGLTVPFSMASKCLSELTQSWPSGASP